MRPDVVHARIGRRTDDDVLDRLADVLFATDEILGLLREPQTPSWLGPLEPRIVEIYDDVNNLMKRISP